MSRSAPHTSGTFLSLEGVDGSGKSTQARLLVEALRAEGHEVVATREPGGSPVAERIRTILLDPSAGPITWATEVLLYLAGRAEHVGTVIRPALERGAVVVCDRFLDSTLAYQGYGREPENGSVVEAVSAIRRANDLGTLGLGPERTYLIDLEPGVGLTRARAGGRPPDRLEGEGTGFLERVRTGFLELARQEPDRFLVLDGDQTIEVISRRIHEDASALLRRKGMR